MLTEGADEYPEPTLVIVNPVTLPLETIAVAVAVVPPPPGAAIVTAGAAVYPAPPIPRVIEPTVAPESTAVPVAVWAAIVPVMIAVFAVFSESVSSVVPLNSLSEFLSCGKT